MQHDGWNGWRQALWCGREGFFQNKSGGKPKGEEKNRFLPSMGKTGSPRKISLWLVPLLLRTQFSKTAHGVVYYLRSLPCCIR
jgi:hypothetical protein